MFGRKAKSDRGAKKSRKDIVHTPECDAIHRAMLMSLYLGYGAPSAPLFIPTGSLMCTCGDEGGGTTTEVATPVEPTSQISERSLVSA
jgi:hypothetical protein